MRNNNKYNMICKLLWVNRSKNKKSAKNGGIFMRKFKAVDAVCIMVLAGIVGFFMGAFLDNSMGGAILFSMVAGFACVVHAIGDREE